MPQECLMVLAVSQEETPKFKFDRNEIKKPQGTKTKGIRVNEVVGAIPDAKTSDYWQIWSTASDCIKEEKDLLKYLRSQIIGWLNFRQKVKVDAWRVIIDKNQWMRYHFVHGNWAALRNSSLQRSRKRRTPEKEEEEEEEEEPGSGSELDIGF